MLAIKKPLLVSIISIAFFFTFVNSSFAGEDTIDGLEAVSIEVAQWDGLPASPSVSPANTARVFYNSTTDTLRLSQNTSAYSDILTLASAPGSDTQVIFNDGGSFAAEAGLTYNKTTDSLTLVGTAFLGLIDLGTNTIDDTAFTGDWAFNSGNLSGIGTLGAGATTVTSLDAGSGAITTTGTITGGAISASSYFLTGQIFVHPSRGLYASANGRGQYYFGSIGGGGAFPLLMNSGDGVTYTGGSFDLNVDGVDVLDLNTTTANFNALNITTTGDITTPIINPTGSVNLDIFESPAADSHGSVKIHGVRDSDDADFYLELSTNALGQGTIGGTVTGSTLLFKNAIRLWVDGGDMRLGNNVGGEWFIGGTGAVSQFRAKDNNMEFGWQRPSDANTQTIIFTGENTGGKTTFMTVDGTGNMELNNGGDFTTTGDITIDSDTNGLILGDGQDVKLYASDAKVRIDGNSVTSCLRLESTDAANDWADLFVNADAELVLMPVARKVWIGDGTDGDNTFGFYSDTSLFTIFHDEDNSNIQLSANDATNYTSFLADGDPVFVGTAGLPFADISVYNNGTADTVATATWSQMTRFDTDGENNNCTPDHTNDHITITKAGRYMVNVSASFSGTPNITWYGGVWKNNGATQLQNMQIHRKLGAGGDVGCVSMSGIGDFAVNDTVEIWIRQDSGANKDITIVDCCLAALQVGGT